MLYSDAGERFATGRARFHDGPEETPKVYIKLAFNGLPDEVTAQLDTGAAWSVISTDVAEALHLSPEGDVREVFTPLGRIKGVLHRISVTLLADEGESLEVDATVFVSWNWEGGLFVGYGGLLERIRFAVDPGRNLFFFGQAS